MHEYISSGSVSEYNPFQNTFWFGFINSIEYGEYTQLLQHTDILKYIQYLF